MSARFLVVRIAGILVTLFAVLTFTFVLTFAVPQDPARSILGPKATQEQVDLVRVDLGLDDPVPVQYGRYLGSVASGDLGFSFSQRRPVLDVIVGRLPYTMLLAAAALLFQLVVGVSVGLLTAARAGGVVDRLALAASVVVIALPGFWIGLVLLFVFGYLWPVLPLGGSELPQGLVLPAVTLGLAGAAWTGRVMRASAYEVLTGDAVRGLRAKGLSPRTVVLRYTARGAAGPVLTMLALDFGFFLGGAVLVESVFDWPGLGLASYQALQQKDIPLLMGCVIVGSLFILVLNLLADIARTKVDPRVTL
ncbi:MAG TPA: ABC transporter permease [Kineosporiaceae bacterium]|nr:ABC transporter permease [Kineosporiaceae bacterium]